MIKDILIVYLLISIIYGLIRAIDRYVEGTKYKYCILDLIFIPSVVISKVTSIYIANNNEKHYTN